MPALTDYNITTLEELLRAHCMPTVHARKVLRRFFDGGGDGIDQIEIPRRLRELIAERIPLRQSSIVTRQLAADGTLKVLIGFDGEGRNAEQAHRVTADAINPTQQSPQHSALSTQHSPANRQSAECVLMPSHRPDRSAGCLSSQIGCAMGCDFCASTRNGVERNLSPGEIIEQFLHLRRESLNLGRRLVTIVFMGMGEPLLNYENVTDAIRRIAGDQLGALGWRQVTVSTVGIVPGIDRLADDGLGVQLAISLHAPDDLTRSRIVPSGKKYRVKEILESADRYQSITRRIVNIEYCMMSGINDSDEQAGLLGELLAGRRMHMNLIPYNFVGPGLSGRVYQQPSIERMRQFAHKLGERNVVAHFRQTRGREIDGACGQLRAGASEPR